MSPELIKHLAEMGVQHPRDPKITEGLRQYQELKQKFADFGEDFWHRLEFIDEFGHKWTVVHTYPEQWFWANNNVPGIYSYEHPSKGVYRLVPTRERLAELESK